MQWIRSLVFTTLLFLTTMAFGVVVLVSALLPLSIGQRNVIPRYWLDAFLEADKEQSRNGKGQSD